MWLEGNHVILSCFFYSHGRNTEAHSRSTYFPISIKHLASTVFLRIKRSFTGDEALLENARKSMETVRRTGDRGGCSPHRIFRGPRDVHFRFLAQRQIFVAACDPMRLVHTRTFIGDLKNIPARGAREMRALFDKSPLTRGRNSSARRKG